MCCLLKMTISTCPHPVLTCLPPEPDLVIITNQTFPGSSTQHSDPPLLILGPFNLLCIYPSYLRNSADIRLPPHCLLKQDFFPSELPDSMLHQFGQQTVWIKALPHCGGVKAGKSTSPGSTPCCLAPHVRVCLGKYPWQSFGPVSHESCVKRQVMGQGGSCHKKKREKQNKSVKQGHTHCELYH